MTDDLKQNKTDTLVAAAKSALGVVPFAGPLLAELVGNLVPNQRLDRLTKYVEVLEQRLSEINGGKIEKTLNDIEGLDLFEESFVQASRALTDERRKYIANIVANGIDDDAIEYYESKYLLKLLQELNEQEIIWLRSFMFITMGGGEDFRNKHSNILTPIVATLGSDDATLKKASLQSSYKEHLERLGLARSRYRMDRKTGMPEFDKFTGRPSVTYVELTTLGRMLLSQIGFTE